MKKFLIAMPTFKNDKGFNYQTVLIKAVDKDDAIDQFRAIKPNRTMGEIKEVNY